MYKNYSSILESKLNEFKKILNSNDDLIIHGANNKLNNILGWVKCNIDFTLIDNDENKLGKIFFEKKVRSSENINLSDYKNILIIPSCFSKDIKDNYIQLGFKGNFYNV